MESKKAKYDQTELDLAQVVQELASLSTRKKVYDEQVSQALRSLVAVQFKRLEERLMFQEEVS
ncbi:hypothetical protein [Lactococcus lactis]|uniref:hypothetical protein n=1 Tax=Lactococcus lactis TaxID=1358 RepID=UPI00056DE9A5|nr:hypothetical protein [Lactococcus lactis]